MNKILVWIIAIAVVLLVGIYFLAGSESTGNAVSEEQELKTFVVTGDHLRFFIGGVENPDMVVNLGDRVRVEYESTEGFHDWKIDEFNVSTDKVRPGNKTSVEFVADQRGTFEYYCSVGQHRANGMKGRFIVQ